jgi:quercetin dioxygenase-like cupin family protein
MQTLTTQNATRRNFLRAMPVVAAAGFTFTDQTLFTTYAAGQTDGPAVLPTYQLFTAQTLQDDIKAVQAKPGNNNLVDSKSLPFTVVLTTEVAKSAKEFEWHESRDHIFQILDGSTVYEVGGTPKNGRNTKPGEWLAPDSEGSIPITLKPGDMLMIPRGTPHRRSTAQSVTFMLIAPTGLVKS